MAGLLNKLFYEMTDAEITQSATIENIRGNYVFQRDLADFPDEKMKLPALHNVTIDLELPRLTRQLYNEILDLFSKENAEDDDGRVIGPLHVYYLLKGILMDPEMFLNRIN